MEKISKKWTHPSRVRKAKVWTGFVADPRVENFSGHRVRGLGNAVRQHPQEGPRGGLLRIRGEVEVTEVSFVRIIAELDGVWAGEYFSEGGRSLQSHRGVVPVVQGEAE